MKTLTIKTASWHFRLMEMLSFDSRYAFDLCEYVWGVIGALILSSFILAVGVGITASFGDALAWLYVGLTYGWSEPNPLGRIAIVIVFVLLLLTLFLLGYLAKEKIPDETREAIGDVWDSVAGRLCVRIKRDTSDSPF